MSDIDELINLIDEMADDITRQVREAKEKALIEKLPAMLKENGVNLCITECRCEGNSVDELRFGFGIDRLDFSEHDKVFEDKIAELEKRIQELDIIDAIRIYEKKELKQRIAELESKESEVCKNEPKISDSTPSMEWYENRHQSDCIEINRLNTTIDVLIHKVEYLRQFVGLE